MKWDEKLEYVATRFIPSSGLSIADFNLSEGVSDEEIERVHEKLGFELSQRFLDYFRASNGWTLRWVAKPDLDPAQADALIATYKASGGTFGEICVPSLEDLFSGKFAHLTDPESDYRLKLFGGQFTESEVLDHLHVLGDPGKDYFKFLTVFAHEEMSDPVCLVADDHGASLTDYRPIRATTFFELQLAYMGREYDIYGRVFEAKGFDGDHVLVDIASSSFSREPVLYGDPNHARIDRAQNLLSYLRTMAGYDMPAGSALTQLPTPRYYKLFKPKPRSKMDKIVQLIKDLDLFEQIEEKENEAHFKHGTFRSGREAQLTLIPPYGKKSPGAYIYYGSDFPEESLEKIVATLLDFGMTLEPFSD